VFVRWDSLAVDREEEQRPLPKLPDGAVVRTFDAPEALNIRFHEIRARSALNRVPKQSRMPFRFTVNPYRGCSHSCVYCISGETPVLMADGRTKPIAEVRVNDEIYGTLAEADYRRYTLTRVVAHWETRKDAYRITLEDGTELIASGDHRFLSNRGWKYVTGYEWTGPLQRPHLTLNNKLMGCGQFAAPPESTAEYKLGYLCGLIRGDGHIGSYSYQRPGRSIDDQHRFRLALADLEALHRAKSYLAEIDVTTQEFPFRVSMAHARPMTAIRTSSRDNVEAVRQVVGWPRNPSDDWAKGFLGGIFDAEGSYSQVIRIANTDPEIIDWTTYCLRRFGFPYVVEPTRNENGLAFVRVTGGLTQNLRFFHTVDPAITRKRSIEWMAIKCSAPLGVAEIEPLGKKMDMFDITTERGDFIANGVVSHNCFARPTHTYLDLNAREDFEREIVVKVNVPEVLRAELGRPSWKREHVALGTNTDPYQWVESRYQLMPEIWKALRDSGTPGSLVTKSPLVLRDIELLKELHEAADMTAFLSVPTLDEEGWRDTEPHTPSPRARLEAVAKLNDAGVPAGVLIAPIMPGINDSPAQLAKIVDLADEAGAVSVGSVVLHLRGEVRDIWFDWLREHRPDLIPRYEEMYRNGAYASSEVRNEISARVKLPRRRRRTPRGTDPGPAPDEKVAAKGEKTGPPQASLF
jgi:DNA repair photolyase